ncbi:helix-turn-helix domain-containing protein [Clostridium faecium]|uniref:Helix-turn-helix domain-containing protein n=1 Tax=Clostridium faecium TaxID=2762223 RepID=A0ABR8YVL5_9CLOT|nr:helix-turn-helix transcriptional regulator [Clostridium faecium]MBD8048280.1 helix-turn-helix domain-containing protein [Clostridium faecium]
MERLQIGEVICKLRKERAITQEQLASFIGVSMAAVSKWENGVSYPDITLLPVLAKFFNVTIDKLLNFEIELSDEEVKKIHSECEKLFNSADNFDLAIEKSKSYILEYPSSYYLKDKIAHLFFAHSWRANDEEKTMEMLTYIIELFEDVASNCTDTKLVECALFALGAMYSQVGEDDKAIDSLNKIHKSQCDPNDILANIYIKQNKFKEARNLLQSKLYKYIYEIPLICMGLANSYGINEKDFDMLERYYKLAINFKKVLSPDGDGALKLWMEYFNLARVYLQGNKNSKAIEALKTMVSYIKRNDINDFGNLNNIWCFNEIERGEKPLTINLYENIFKMLEDSVFDPIRECKEFKNILTDLKDLEVKSLAKK